MQKTDPNAAPRAVAGRSTPCMMMLVASKKGNLMKLVESVVFRYFLMLLGSSSLMA